MPPILQRLRYDLPASLVGFFVAVTLCLGIALASGAPLFAGPIAGAVGGIVVGYKLAKPALFRQMYAQGWEQFIPFLATVVGILATDLLRGIAIGLLVGGAVILRHNLRNPFTVAQHPPETDEHRIQLAEEVSFLNKGQILQQLQLIPPQSHVVIDATRSKIVGFDVMEILRDFRAGVPARQIAVEIHGLTLDKETP